MEPTLSGPMTGQQRLPFGHGRACLADGGTHICIHNDAHILRLCSGATALTSFSPRWFRVSLFVRYNAPRSLSIRFNAIP